MTADTTPDFLYGTAWKEDRTATLTESALRAGFRGIDTANQRKHYFEAAIGEGLGAAYRAGIVTRDDLSCKRSSPTNAGRTIVCSTIRTRDWRFRLLSL